MVGAFTSAGWGWRERVNRMSDHQTGRGRKGRERRRRDGLEGNQTIGRGMKTGVGGCGQEVEFLRGEGVGAEA